MPFRRSHYDAFVALEGVYFEALGGHEDASVANGGPWAEALFVDSSPRSSEHSDAPPFDCHVSFLLVSAPQGIYGEEGGEDGSLSDDELAELSEDFEEYSGEEEEYGDEEGEDTEEYDEEFGADYYNDL